MVNMERDSVLIGDTVHVKDWLFRLHHFQTSSVQEVRRMSERSRNPHWYNLSLFSSRCDEYIDSPS